MELRRIALISLIALSGCGPRCSAWTKFDTNSGPSVQHLVLQPIQDPATQTASIGVTPVTRLPATGQASQIIYLAHRGEIAAAISQYQLYEKEKGHDFGIVRALAAAALRQAATSDDEEMRSVALFGAAYSGDRSLLPILGNALEDPAPEKQLLATSLLGSLDEEAAGTYLQKALASPYPPIRIEACFALARRGEDASPHLLSLLEYGEPFQVAACEIVSAQDTPGSNALLRRLMVQPRLKVRAAAICSCALRRRDDFLPLIRQTLTHIDPVEQEACCGALGKLGDTEAIPALRTIAAGRSDLSVRLAALNALYQLGDHSVRPQVEALALEGSRHAITVLGRMEGSEPVLLELTRSDDLTIRTVASLALLERRHPGCWPGLKAILVRDARDLVWLQDYSQGLSLVTWKRMTHHSSAEQPQLFHWADKWRAEVLIDAAQLPTATFIQIAQTLLETNQNDLVLITVRILERLGDEGLQLLHRMSEQAGAPFVRTACHLALMRSLEEGPHQQRLLLWLAQNQQLPLELRQTLRPDLSETYRVTLTPDERSQLILDITSALASHPTPEAMNALLDLMIEAHPTVRIAVAACLLQALI